jgi:hypothetical protein
MNTRPEIRLAAARQQAGDGTLPEAGPQRFLFLPRRVPHAFRSVGGLWGSKTGIGG